MKTELRDRPTKEEITQLPPFVGLPLGSIHLLKTEAQFDAALRDIKREKHIGFDTESKPTFKAGSVSDGPHVIQFALHDRAFIVQVDAHPCPALLAFLKTIIESQEIVKVGFGLKSDRGPLHRKLGIGLGAIIELSQTLKQLGYKQALGAKAAVAIVLGRRLQKSKSVTTSNWAAPNLTPNQLIGWVEERSPTFNCEVNVGLHENRSAQPTYNALLAALLATKSFSWYRIHFLHS